MASLVIFSVVTGFYTILSDDSSELSDDGRSYEEKCGIVTRARAPLVVLNAMFHLGLNT